MLYSSPMYDISVVIGAYNQIEILPILIEAYSKQTYPLDRFEVIIVDSTSPDGTGDWFKTVQAPFNFKGIVQENRGKSGARNRGVDEAESELIIITDSDMIPGPDFIELHVQAHKSVEGPACFEGVTMNMTRLEWPIQDQSILYPYIRENIRDGKKLGWWYFLTGNISFPRQLFLDYGGFDETFQVYGWEDLELGYRLFKDKVPLYFLKSCLNYHYHVVSEDGEIERNVKKGESAKIFLDKHPELKWFLGLNPLSRFLRPRISKHNWIYKLMEKWHTKGTGLRYKFAFWFLKEYHYLTGIMGLKQT